jgi:sialic acid synthase SpsE
MSVYIVAEVGSTHGGSLGNAMQAVEVFAKAGADAVKLQDHFGQLVDSQAQHPPWFQGPRHILTRRQYLWDTCLASDEWAELANHCHRHGVEYVCSPFSYQAAQRQAGLVDKWKVASGQITNIPMLELMAASDKAVIASKGLATQMELARAREALHGAADVVWLECQSVYPCPPKLVGLSRERLYGEGLSDHTEGLAACLGAVALGARVLEKHVTLSRHMYGSDARYAMEPDEFAQLVREVRALEKMLMPRDDAEYERRIAETRAGFMHAEVAR